MSSPESNSTTTSIAPHRWLSIIGIGEDGIAGLSTNARALISNAELVAGGTRHLALASDLIKARQLAWPSPIADAIDIIGQHKGRPVVVLASGDPFNYGIGTMLAQAFPARQILCLPQPSAFSLACARMGWSLPDIQLVTLHGRPLAGLNRHLFPRARILALSWDETTPAAVATELTRRGLGAARLTVLESMAGPNERQRSSLASKFNLTSIGPLNTLAIELPECADIASSTTISQSFACLTPGLEDSMYDHDGQLTKRDIRAITISALAPRPGELLWDIGLGAGSIGIEWLLCHNSLRAIGFEKDTTRADRARKNACALGAPEIEVVTGSVPQSLEGQPAPGAVFIGGGLTKTGTFDTSWNALKTGGRLVANAVTLESEAILADLHAKFGGELLKIEVSRAAPVGRLRGWRSSMPVVQWRVTKS